MIVVSFFFLFLILFSYMFDEPSSYLDVKQRLKCALTIRSLLNDERYIKYNESSDKSCF